ncbi:hypothetical protein VCHENC02_2984B, partial [Vibrio harveyi]
NDWTIFCQIANRWKTLTPLTQYQPSGLIASSPFPRLMPKPLK